MGTTGFQWTPIQLCHALSLVTLWWCLLLLHHPIPQHWSRKIMIISKKKKKSITLRSSVGQGWWQARSRSGAWWGSRTPWASPLRWAPGPGSPHEGRPTWWSYACKSFLVPLGVHYITLHHLTPTLTTQPMPHSITASWQSLRSQDTFAWGSIQQTAKNQCNNDHRTQSIYVPRRPCSPGPDVCHALIFQEGDPVLAKKCQRRNKPKLAW